MNLDLCTDLLARGILRRVDPQATGVFIEIGLGSLNYSFTWAAPAGFRCEAIEPLPTENLLQASRKLHVPVTVAAIAGGRGQAPMYFGKLHEQDYADVSSLNPRWWGSGENQRMVPCLTLLDFVEDKKIAAISCLKVDTEGSELLALQALPALAENRRPAVVVFEYGGGGMKKDGQKGWSPEFFANTLACLKVLQGLGYTRGFLIEAILDAPRPVDLDAETDWEKIFPQEALAGNFLFVRDALPAEFLGALVRETTEELNQYEQRQARQARRDRLINPLKRIVRGIQRRLPGRKN